MSIPSPLRAVLALVGFSLFAPLVLAAPEPPPIVSAEEIARQLSLSTPLPRARTRKIEFERSPEASLPAARPVSRRIALPAIEFEFDSDRLTPYAWEQVTQLARALALDDLRPFVFAVQGHTDSVGDRGYNRALSMRRARAVKRHLVAERIAEDRLVEIGLGEDFPVPDLPADDARNRRVEIVHLGPTGGGEAPVVAQRSGRRALLIGIDAYRNVSNLVGPVNDAMLMRDFVTSGLGFDPGDVRLLLNAEATRDNILRELDEWIVDGTRPGDEVFLFFSGHGFQQPDTNGDEPDRFDETLVPVDVVVRDDETVSGMITDDEMAAVLGRLSGRHVNMVVDACHSGTSDRSVGARDGWRYVKSPRRLDGGTLPLGVVGPARAGSASAPEVFVSAKDPQLRTADLTVWAAVEAHQKALIDEEVRGAPMSVFTGRLLSGVRDAEADADFDGVVTRSELHAYLIRESEAYCDRHRHRCARGLTPQLHGASGSMDAPAFVRVAVSLPPQARVAKDILIGPASSAAADRFEGGVKLRIAQGTRLEVGTEVSVEVTSPRDGYLVLLDIDAAGDMVQIFPNEISLRNGAPERVRAGDPMRLPSVRDSFRLRVSPPAGRGTLVAIVSDETPQLGALTARHKDLSVVERPKAYLVEMAEVLRAGGDSPHRTVGTLVYETVMPGQ